MEERPIKRLYYSIAEVSEITGLKPYVLRYWETEFSELNPQKNRAGNRAYKKNDIQLIFAIKRLLYEEKYTIEGARQRLRQMKDKKELAGQLSLLEESKKNGILQDIRAGLIDCLKILEKHSFGA
ncbi:MerR family transcriptional regulator [candidate division KSB1 bacterium]|nr:MerR family transcriptional regulator [candidate division KSB1 bacterium]RQW05489.1 MAG: MerR family transcriptional regulator [candidate division KSB1 bacterium]